MRTTLLTLVGKTVSSASKLVNFGNGSTWPGHIALSLEKSFIKNIIAKNNLKVILVAGTNGKTTTTTLIRHILLANGKKTLQNKSGANLLSGIASTLLLNSRLSGKVDYEYAIFEVDENSLPRILDELTPDYLVLLNLFRDQLDRYGEVNTIATNWQKALSKLPKTTTLLLNADDPQIAYLSKNTSAKTLYFGLKNEKESKSGEHASDSTYCPKCGKKLIYTKRFFSHLGEWECPNCKLTRPKLSENTFPIYSLLGVYNKYNTNAATLLCKTIGIAPDDIEESVQTFSPAFGRQEIIQYRERNVQLFLSKNPTSLNQSLRTVEELGGKYILFVLNDRIPDGRDVSWIWDVDFENYLNNDMKIFISGDRAYDMGLRLKYAQSENVKLTSCIEPDLEKAISSAVMQTPENETLYVLPTYSAMLEVRQILTGKKIL